MLMYDVLKLEDDDEVLAARLGTDATTYTLRPTGSPTLGLLGSESRYASVELVEYTTPDVTFRLPAPWIIPVSNSAAWRYYRIENRFAHRPDMISYLAYNQSFFWWRIMRHNQLLDFEDLETGITLEIPSS